jgi:lysyl endopeptidase
MHTKIYIFFFSILLSFSSFSQITDMNNPISWNSKLNLSKKLQTVEMPGFDQALINAEDALNDPLKNAPWRFGYKYETNINLQNNGVWTDLPGGNRIWRTEIVAAGALTINLTLENVHFPEGAYLYLYDIAKTHIVGAYTSRNNHPSGELGTDLVHGDRIVVEYFEPAAVRGQGEFTINGVTHGYRSLNIIQKSLEKALNSSGDCNYDARCPVDPYVGGLSAWDDQIRSVAMIVTNGSGICTGALINNSCNDGTPYFLTANHCLGGGTGNWLFRFNWDVPEGNAGMSCATTANTPTSFNTAANYDQTTVNGATILVSGTQADHALLLMDNMTATDATSWNLFYAGWSNDDTESAVNAVTGIHHPSGDIKKICRAYENGGVDNIHHANAAGAAVWYMDAWDEGVTEPGSSGSPLFDQNGRIIGQLYGGSAACQGTSANGYDYYGRLGVSWSLGIGTYLDPASCGGTTIINDGWDPNAVTTVDDASIQGISSPVAELCGDNFDPVVTLKNAGMNALTSATILYNIDGGANLTYSWIGNLVSNASETITLPNMTVTAGPHVFNASSSTPNGTADTNPVNDASLVNFNATIGGQPATLTISTDCWGYETYWEIVDAGTTTIVTSGGNSTGIAPGGSQTAGTGDAGSYGDETVVTENLCLAYGCYDIIMYDDWGDGMEGTSANCAIDGDWVLTDGSGTTLVQMSTINYASDTSNFCLASPCTGTITESHTNLLCNGDASGTAIITVNGGNAPFTYDIGNGPQVSETFTGLAAGSYTVTIIDNSACSNSINIVLTEPTVLISVVASINETCLNVTDGQITCLTSGGTSPYQYSIDCGATFQPSEIFSGLAPNNYCVLVTDDNNCQTTENVNITTGTGVLGTTQVTDISCNGLSDGSIEALATNGTAPFTYSIDGGITTQSINTFAGLAAGPYTISITDANGCSGDVNGTIVNPAGLSGLPSVTDEVSGNDGTIDIVVSGGTPTYTFSWTGPGGFSSSSQNINGLIGGLYSLTITDLNGCTTTITDILVNSFVGLDENMEFEFSVFPNPTNGIFNVALNREFEKEITLSVFDLCGRLVYKTYKTGNGTFEVNITDKANGSYILKLEVAGKQVQRRIIKFN